MTTAAASAVDVEPRFAQPLDARIPDTHRVEVHVPAELLPAVFAAIEHAAAGLGYRSVLVGTGGRLQLGVVRATP